MNDFARPGLGQTELPPVNSDDNGKVLGVNNGAWDKVDAPSGGGSDTLFAHFTLSGESVVCDCTVSEVNEAIEAGKEVVGVFTNNRASLSGVKKYIIYGDEYILYFSFIDLYTGGSGNKLYVYNISMEAPAGTISKTVYNVALST